MISTSKLAFVLSAALPAVYAATYDVQVGPGGKFVYEPEWVVAAPGDTVNFIFNPKNHTATQSAFAAPCVALQDGLTSGFKPVTADTTPAPNHQVQVTDTNPMWFYCQQGTHCSASGMVFAINPPTEGPNTFAAFKQLATGGAGAGASSTPPPPATTAAPTGPNWVLTTATVTYQSSVYTTTYSSYIGSAPPTPAAVPVVHKILVGDGGSLAYDPPSIQASIGDTVTFEFRAKNHTVTQSSFGQPCVRRLDADQNRGFASGFQPVAQGATDFPTYSIMINDTAPIWGYCGQTAHCGQGMVFAINAIEDSASNFEAFQALAVSINGSGTAGGNSSSTGNGTSSGSNSDGALAIGGSTGLVGGIVALALALASFL